MLSFADAYHIFTNLDENHIEKGVCLANIGSIMMQMGDYHKSREYFLLAIQNLKVHMGEGINEGIEFKNLEKSSRTHFI